MPKEQEPRNDSPLRDFQVSCCGLPVVQGCMRFQKKWNDPEAKGFVGWLKRTLGDIKVMFKQGVSSYNAEGDGPRGV